MTAIIDAHQHFWQPARGDYGWLTPDMEPLYRDFLPDDLAPLMVANGVVGTVLVQAAPTEAETRFLLDIADAHDFVRGVVGWTDFAAADAAERLAGADPRGVIRGLGFHGGQLSRQPAGRRSRGGPWRHRAAGLSPGSLTGARGSS